MKCPFCIKVCSKCGRILVANTMNFNKKKGGKWGLRADCKRCRKEYHKEYHKEYRENNKEKIKEYKKKYRENNKKQIKERSKKYYENNKEHYKKYRENNKEHHKEYKKKWYENNPEKVFNYANKRRRLEENQGNGITKDQWLEMMNFFDWKCAYSDEYIGGKENNFIRSIDHIIPLSNGGLNEIWNLVPMLKNLNSSKNSSDMLSWYTKQPFYSEERLNKIYEWQKYAFEKYSNQ